MSSHSAPAASHGPPVAAAPAASSHGGKTASMILSTYWNEQTSWYYWVAMGGLIAVFTISHWSRHLYSRHASKALRDSALMKVQVAITRSVRHVLLRRVPGFTSVGHAGLVATYLGINIALTVTNIRWVTLTGIGKRCGWMALLNMGFITLLALKNTPLAFLTAYSYERLNPLHQIGGYTTCAYVFVHLVVLSKAFVLNNKPEILLEREQIYGIVAGCFMFIMLVSAIVIRRARYELFYLTHIIMYILLLIYVPLHVVHHNENASTIAIVVAAVWGADRLLRGSRILWYSHGNHATITPLKNGGTRIVLSRSPSRATPGNHCFVWIPKIRLIESHPFTIVSATPTSLELVIAAYDGFTNDLRRYAVKHPGSSLQASIDGPYGATPDFVKTADKVLLIAGGSGASFTFGVALDMLRRLGDSTNTTIEFVWCVKEYQSLSWYKNQLTALQNSPVVITHIHVTRSALGTSSTLIESSADDEKNGAVSKEASQPPSNHPYANVSTKSTLDVDVEKVASSTSQANPWDSTSSLEVVSGRPNIDALVRSLVESAGAHERVAVASCGPDAMMKDVRRVTASVTRVSGPSVELHCEQFGW
ncbi:ferric reductase NAD binding domain-containing protein [Bisporella sp. PMI_857]|nr:ferric reductase NAD binding domain-containing protein [Bisporella sp. PMI_857]